MKAFLSPTLARPRGWPAPRSGSLRLAVASAVVAALAGACTPTVRVEAPKDPIRIDLNVNIQQDVRIRLEKSVEQIHENNPDIF